jgi:hypothetical protein
MKHIIIHSVEKCSVLLILKQIAHIVSFIKLMYKIGSVAGASLEVLARKEIHASNDTLIHFIRDHSGYSAALC